MATETTTPTRWDRTLVLTEFHTRILRYRQAPNGPIPLGDNENTSMWVRREHTLIKHGLLRRVNRWTVQITEAGSGALLIREPNGDLSSVKVL